MKRYIKELKNKIIPVLKRYDVVRAAVFGSFVRGEMKKNSDIDLLIIKETSKPFHKRWMEVCDMVHGILGATPFSPFVITSKELKRRLARGDHFFKEILSKGEVLYEAKFSS